MALCGSAASASIWRGCAVWKSGRKIKPFLEKGTICASLRCAYALSFALSAPSCCGHFAEAGGAGAGWRGGAGQRACACKGPAAGQRGGS
eukprot:3383616-Pleurochrysis_carterae.AAC.2